MMTVAVMFAVFVSFLLLAIGFKLDRIAKHIRDTGDRYFAKERAYQEMERAANVLAGKVDHVAEHFTYPSIAEPVPLPSLDDETAAEKKPKRRKRPV